VTASAHSRTLRRSVVGPLLLIALLPAVCVSVRQGTAASSPLPRQSVSATLQSAAPLSGRDFFAAPNATDGGDGSLKMPWHLEEALAQPDSVRPGDTIWLRGGTYRRPSGEPYWAVLTGTPDNPIRVRQYPGERATLDGGDTHGKPVLILQGAYTWYWGFEVSSSDPKRISSQPGPAPTDMPRGSAVEVEEFTKHPGLKLINLTIHDTLVGVGWWEQAVDSEIYGCLIYNNGWIGADHPHGHGIYAQNLDGLKVLRDSLLFRNFSHNFHAYTENRRIDNFYIRGNAFFEAGLMPDPRRDFLVGGSVPSNNVIVRENTVYNSDDVSSDFQLGYGSPAFSPIVLDNYLPRTSVSAYLAGTPTVSGNTLSRVDASDLTSFSQNTWLDSPPTDTKVIVRPNAYEPGRGFVFVFNWRHAPVVSVDLSAVLSLGAEYEVRNAFDVFAPRVVRGVYQGGSVSFPLVGLSTAVPVGLASAPARDGVVQAFLVLTTGVGRLAPVPVSRPPRRTRSLD
jgi:hypothetical protein